MKMHIYPVFILILMCSNIQKSDAIHIAVDKILNLLNKVLDYSLKNPNSIGLSSIFGIVRTKALLTDVVFSNKEESSLLHLIKNKCGDILKLKINILKQYDDWVMNISDPFLWDTKISYKYLEDKCYYMGKNQTKKFLGELRNEAETACITPEVFEFCLNNSYQMKKFKTNSACSYLFLTNYEGIGYETTHRLLFLQIMRMWQLYPKSQKIHIESLCRHIYLQAKATRGRTFFFDLFLEQIFLCGVEGYKEFLNVKWLDMILDNQLEQGCFPVFTRGTNLNSSVHDEECSDHATGLASAVLALHIHFKWKNESVK
ncbi:uncharacterized protein LOC123683423 isoform X1 [Harmonia axyridis]|uniref:uncharacterized protein LOC123683423 isoform X1 n=1 Tax=Harmonia axyridis TaxID=115357 RepID=UPI001E275D66|nr:uncharacterized protein LOC123683423 isoform X1 [Harmonia axyridis]